MPFFQTVTSDGNRLASLLIEYQCGECVKAKRYEYEENW